MMPALWLRHPEIVGLGGWWPQFVHVYNMPGTGLRARSTDPLSALTAQEEEEVARWSAAKVA